MRTSGVTVSAVGRATRTPDGFAALDPLQLAGGQVDGGSTRTPDRFVAFEGRLGS